MSDVPASDATLACSRCDGPVRQEDLVEGIAVRVDGQPVCALCIETLPPAVRVQINRVRALKGLAVTTYRMAWILHPDANRYTFTSAGLLLLHRRALVHGTEFPTPELPSGTRPPPPSAPPAPPAPRNPLTLFLVAGVAIAVIAGVVGLLTVSSAPAKDKRSPAPAPQGPGVPPPVIAAPQSVPPPASTARIETPPAARPVRSAADYLAGDTTAIQGFLAAEADDAPREVRQRLADLVRADRDTQLRRAKQFLERDQFDPAAKQLDSMRIPPGREEFREQEEAEATVRFQLDKRRKAAASIVVTPPVTAPVDAAPVLTAPVVTAPTASVPPPVTPVAPITPPPQAPITAMPTMTIPLQVVPAAPGSVGEAPLVPTGPKPVAGAHTPHIEPWTGPLGPQNQPLLEADGRSKIPSPWPFSPALASPRFAPAVEVRGADRKERFTLQLTFRAELVRDGGVCIALHPFSPKRKELVITRPDLPGSAEVRVSFAEAQWLPVTLPIAATDQAQVQIQIADSTYTGSDPFWLGGVVQVSDGSPDPSLVGLLPPGLQTADPIFDPSLLLRLLKGAAKARGEERRWSDPKYLTIDDGIKILAAATGSAASDDKQKALVYESLKLRTGASKVDYLLLREDVTDPDSIALLMARTTSPKLDAPRPLVVLVPDGQEAALDPDEWSKRVSRISAMLLEGPSAKVRGGWIPVWVVGNLDGSPGTTAAWSKVRSVLRVPIIDLTAGSPRTPQQAVSQLTESLRALMHQFRWVQITHAGK